MVGRRSYLFLDELEVFHWVLLFVIPWRSEFFVRELRLREDTRGSQWGRLAKTGGIPWDRVPQKHTNVRDFCWPRHTSKTFTYFFGYPPPVSQCNGNGGCAGRCHMTGTRGSHVPPVPWRS